MEKQDTATARDLEHVDPGLRVRLASVLSEASGLPQWGASEIYGAAQDERFEAVLAALERQGETPSSAATSAGGCPCHSGRFPAQCVATAATATPTPPSAWLVMHARCAPNTSPRSARRRKTSVERAALARRTIGRVKLASAKQKGLRPNAREGRC